MAVTSSVPTGRAVVWQDAVSLSPTGTSLQRVVAPRVKVSLPSSSNGTAAVTVTESPAVRLSELAVAQMIAAPPSWEPSAPALGLAPAGP